MLCALSQLLCVDVNAKLLKCQPASSDGALLLEESLRLIAVYLLMSTSVDDFRVQGFWHMRQTPARAQAIRVRIQQRQDAARRRVCMHHCAPSCGQHMLPGS